MQSFDNYFELNKNSSNNYELKLFSNWNKQTLSSIIEKLEKLNLSNNSKLEVDFQGLIECDNSAMIYLISFFRRFQEQNLMLKLYLKWKNHFYL